MKILFWNTNRNKEINKYVASLVQDNNIDVLVLAEYKDDGKNLCAQLKKDNINLDSCNTSGCERISVFSNYVNVEAGFQNKYCSIQIIKNSYILCCMHLITDLHGNRDDERLEIIQDVMHECRKSEEKINSQDTIIIGDLNEMPYGKGCLNANGLHGLPALDITDDAIRTVNGKAYRKFYNPMWNLMGDFSYPPGTYFLNQSKLYSPMWYMLDQIIISHDLLPYLNKGSVKIITSCSASDLSDKTGHPDKKISDHFPIMCEVRDKNNFSKGRIII